MNERILGLAKQAGLKFPSETAMSAESKICRAIEAYNWADSVYRNLETAQIYKAAIEKHFGVTE